MGADKNASAAMSWERLERTLATMRELLRAAKTEEDFQAIGHRAREALISLAQAVYNPSRHHVSGKKRPSTTDAKSMLEAFVADALRGKSHEEGRRLVRSTVQFADALTHKRSADSHDANLCLTATHGLVNIIALLVGHNRAGTEVSWYGIEVGNRYFAWDGPNLHSLPDRPPVPTPPSVTRALQARGIEPSFGPKERLMASLAQGKHQVFETDRATWRREMLYADDGNQVLLVLDPQLSSA